MPATLVTTLSFYRHPQTGRRIPLSQERAYRKWYARRFKGRRPRRENWLYTLDGQPSQKRQGLKIGGQYHRIQLQYKMTAIEKILPLSGFTNRHIRETFNKHGVFADIWNNWGGIIRMVISGTIPDGTKKGRRRIKEIIHLGYHKEHWELSARRRGGREVSGREMFRRWLVSAVSTNLRRRGLRLSNPKESADRIAGLQQDLARLHGQTEYIGYMRPERMGAHVQQILWKANAITKQRKTKQLRGATIRIEKLI